MQAYYSIALVISELSVIVFSAYEGFRWQDLSPFKLILCSFRSKSTDWPDAQNPHRKVSIIDDDDFFDIFPSLPLHLTAHHADPSQCPDSVSIVVYHQSWQPTVTVLNPSPSFAVFRSRDMSKRQTVASNELLRRAYKYISRNTTIPTRVRHQAQLALNDFPNKSRREVVKERCTETGRGRGIITEFGLCRVSSDDNSEIRETEKRTKGGQDQGQRKGFRIWNSQSAVLKASLEERASSFSLGYRLQGPTLDQWMRRILTPALLLPLLGTSINSV